MSATSIRCEKIAHFLIHGSPLSLPPGVGGGGDMRIHKSKQPQIDTLCYAIHRYFCLLGMEEKLFHFLQKIEYSKTYVILGEKVSLLGEDKTDLYDPSFN